MSELRSKIKAIIEKEREDDNFSILDTGKSILLIEQIIKNYKRTGQLKKAKSSDKGKKEEAELIFVAAPTGAGKDHLVAKLNHQNSEKKYVELNMDIFRHYFPLYVKNIESLTDKDYAVMTNQFSYEIYATIQELILEEFPGTNVIITGTLRETDWVEQVMRRFKSDEKTKYTVKLAGLAVPKKESAISVIYRYVSIVNTEIKRLTEYPGTARYTTKSYHDETFEKFPENFRYFEDLFRKNPGELIDSIDVYARSKDMGDLSDDSKVYSSEDKDDTRSATDVIMELRSKKYEISYDQFSLISKRIMANKDYLKSQGTLREIIRDLAVLLDYPKIVQRLDEIEEETRDQV